ncbi:MAG: hypothetical protein LBH00_01750 [Planctomycetaceae bacterium]|jgi:hypothetical protein|nr:hypothetical protein [Planctomycetaceae bacterium]
MDKFLMRFLMSFILLSALTGFADGEAGNTKKKNARNNPLLLEHPVLYVARPQYNYDHHNTETLFQTGEINTKLFKGKSSLRLWNPKNNNITVLLDVPEGIVRDPCLSFDAGKILVSLRRNIRDDYHLYELTLKTGGWLNAEKLTVTEKEKDIIENRTLSLVQLTFLSGASDIDPLYLPDGNIVFSSTREPKYCMCNRHIMANLYKMNGDGSNIQQIGKSTLFEGHASLLPDGRILYDRWEYVDRNFGDAQGLWTTTPEGFNHAVFWGNNTSSPGGVIDARILPGSSGEFLAVFTSTHDHPWGAVALIDRQRGIDGKKAVLQTFPADALGLIDDGSKDHFTESMRYDTFKKVSPKMEDPFPLSADWFLASGQTGEGNKIGIYLLGRDGTMEAVHTDSDYQGCFDPMPMKPATPPPVNVQTADLTKTEGDFYVTNVYEGFHMADVPKGSVKFLRVVESPEKRTWTQNRFWENRHGQQFPGMSWTDFNNKRILGTVPVEADGSVRFTVPADTWIYFQLLDEQGRMIQTMRSGIIIRPGETNGCTGCHEDRLATVPLPAAVPAALTKPPQPLKEWYGKPRLFSYVEEVQKPVFDRYCVACHDYGKTGDHPNMPNLAGDFNTIFNTSFVEIYQRHLIKTVGTGPHTKLKPYTWGAVQSKLADVMLNGHGKKEIDEKRRELGLYVDCKTQPEAADRVITWIDINAPYYPVYATSFPDNRFGRSPVSDAMWKRLAELTRVKTGFTDGDKNRTLDWLVSFSRPELSPCLEKLPKDSAEYQEALTILREGKASIEKYPRGENAAAVVLPPRDAEQEAKYQRFRRLEERMRQAIISGTKLRDR